MAFRVKLAPLCVNLAVDTGAAVNLLALDTYTVLQRAARGSRYALRPHDIHLSGVGADKLDVHGVVTLPISFLLSLPFVAFLFPHLPPFLLFLPSFSILLPSFLFLTLPTVFFLFFLSIFLVDVFSV